MRKSEPYKRSGKIFRYNYDNATVEWVSEATEDELKDNERWMKEWGKPMWDIDDDGYCVIDSVGLSRSNWDDREMRDSYLDMWIDDLEEEMRYLLR